VCDEYPEFRLACDRNRHRKGAVAAGCHHNGCRGKGWHDLRDTVEPGWQSRGGDGGPQRVALPQPWGPPSAFDRHVLPFFPVAALPDWLGAFVEAEATATQTPVDLAGMLILSVMAAACAKKVIVRVKEGYDEPVNLFAVVALRPGNRKTAVFAAAMLPLEQYERSEANRTAREIAQHQAAYKIKEATLKKAQDQAVNATGIKRQRFTEEAAALAGELAETVVPVATRCIVDDCTPEKLPGLLRDQGGRIAAMSPEGDVFDLMAGRYSSNKSSNLGVYLKGHAGDTLHIDRVGRPTEFVQAPALTIGLAVQPEVIRGLAENPGFRGRGLLGRFLYALPESLMGHRDTNPSRVPAAVSAAYRANVLALLYIPLGRDDLGEPVSQVLTMDSSARESLQHFEQWVEPQLSEFGELGGLPDWGGKIVGAVARIAGLLHMAEYAGATEPWRIPISGTTVACAVRIGKYLIPHARAAYALMGADEVIDSAKAILRWIKHKGLDQFTRRDVHQAMRSTFKRAMDVDAPLAILAERKFVRKRIDERGVGPGRSASPTYDVNPLCSTQERRKSPQETNSEYCEYSEAASPGNQTIPHKWLD
jgi:replicative DNA helicase